MGTSDFHFPLFFRASLVLLLFAVRRLWLALWVCRTGAVSIGRCWAYETGVLLGKEIDEAIPYNDYFEYYAPDFKLHLTPVSGG